MKQDIHQQAGESNPEKQMNEERIIRRMVLECIYPLAAWSETQPALTQEVVQSTARRKGLYETYDKGTRWADILQDFLHLDVEVIRLIKPLNLPRLMERGDGEITRRLEELGDKAEDTLLACWHQDTGLIAVTWPDTDTLPKSIRPLRKLLIPVNREVAALWSWSKHNFPEQ